MMKKLFIALNQNSVAENVFLFIQKAEAQCMTEQLKDGVVLNAHILGKQLVRKSKLLFLANNIFIIYIL